MMKKSWIILFMLLSLVSCKKFLDQEPSNSLNDQTAFQKFQDIRIALNGCYKGMLSVNYYGKNFIIYPEIAADNLKLNLEKSTGRFQAEYNYALTSTSSSPFGLWNIGYDIIHRANNILLALPSIKDATEAEKNNAKGEALAIRALVHFDLVRAFAHPYNSDSAGMGIPVITETNTNPKPARNTVAEVYAQILSDLANAAALMTSTSNFIFSQNAVKALLARVNLYKENWTDALKYSTGIINNNSSYSLVPYADYIASWGKEFSTEAILELGFRSDDYLVTDALGYELLEGGYGDLIPTNDIKNEYASGDIRLQWIKGGENQISYCNKYPGRGGLIGLDNIKVIRLSEMFLIAAEAAAESKDETNALKYLNVLRKRSDASVSDTILTGAALKNLIQAERRRELAFEGHRLFDLTRKKKAISRKDFIPGNQNYKDYTDNRIIMPMPQRELDVNINIKQNPGY